MGTNLPGKRGRRSAQRLMVPGSLRMLLGWMFLYPLIICFWDQLFPTKLQRVKKNVWQGFVQGKVHIAKEIRW